METGNQGDDDGGHRNTSSEIHSGSPEAADTGDGAGDPYAAAYAAYLAAMLPCNTGALGRAATNNAGAGGMIYPFPSLSGLWFPPSPPPPPPSNLTWATLYGHGLGSLAGVAGCVELPPEPEIENTGIVMGETIGWRCWNVHESGHLQSMAATTIWLPNEPIKADAVSARHGSGVHAFKTLAQAVDQYGCYGVSRTIMFGRVALWGEVVEFTKGYKGEHGYPATFDYLKPKWGHEARERRGTQRELNELRQLYGLNTVPLNKIAEGANAGWRERAVQAFARMMRV